MEITNDVLATKGKRFGNFVIDLIFRYVLFFIIGIIAAIIDPEGFLAWSESIGRLEELMYGIIVLVIYFIVTESLFQRTLGKLITGTKVITEDGSKPNFGTIVIRTLCRLIPFEAFSFLGDYAYGWHDSLSKTYVVDVKIYNEALNRKNSFDEIGTTQF
ncbi:MAG: RDD family protein [Flavobacterium sp.]